MNEFILETLLRYKEKSDDKICPVAACCKVNGEWYFGVNKIDYDIPQSDIDQRSELFYNTVEHAEINLLKKLECAACPKNTPIFVTLFPCDRCMKVLIDKGIKTIYYLEDHPDCNWSKRSHKRAEEAGIEIIKISR